jgi:hypothetical protein
MHPRQASLITHATAVAKQTAGDTSKTASMERKAELPPLDVQLRMMKSHPPQIVHVRGVDGKMMHAIEVYGPSTRKYFPVAEWLTPEQAEDDLKSWVKSHKETIKNIQQAIKSQDKTASSDNPWKA